ncbi:MAG: AsnC family transcriptional regulator [Acidovorax sp. SCN 65-28]|uniref:Lrp/AsnC family transcriptional regulator n=1 Tax=Acidovorax sp. TaxID=1872122 RepID=UPI00086DCA2F|nr:Lrp/AsnC family transcriptional regulator [Acidovorax sp.]MBN9626462.1 Lrp/AsnC family transcriptional regulator [Acidovorax sp.]ODS78461.1 MAG: AsnC family transcriptional regulator [Acidovorax sp. SCN 65-28]OJT96472.1 MAG: AsnC family transcriptional regulator [Acidovorax sp. 65-7]
MSTPATLDRFDLAILDILQADNTTPQRAIAQAVNLSAPAVQRRIQRLKDSGVIRANVAMLDPVKVGKPLTIVLEVHLDNERPDRTAPLRARIAAEDAVQQCYSVTGEADYLLVVNVASMADYEALTRRLFDGDDNIKRFRTSVALASLKTGLRVPLDSAAPAA